MAVETGDMYSVPDKTKKKQNQSQGVGHSMQLHNIMYNDINAHNYGVSHGVELSHVV